MVEPLELPEECRRFAEEYPIDFKVNKAAARAGISTQLGNTLLRDPRVIAIIREQKRRVSDSINVSASLVIETLRIIATVNACDARSLVTIPKDGMPYLDLTKLTDEEQVAVKGYKWTKEGPVIEFHSKMEAVKLLGQYYALFKDGLEISGPGGAAISVSPDMTPRDAAEAYRQLIEGP